MSDSFEITEDQRKVANALITEGMRIERERILNVINANKTKTISISKLNKLISEN